MLAKITSLKYLKSESDAENAAVLALYKVIEKFKHTDFATIDENRGYIFTMIKNTCISELRKLNTQRKYYVLYDVFYSFSITCIDLEKEAEIDELILKVEKEIDELSYIDKRIVQMKFYEKKSYKEMAVELNICPNSMGTRYSRAMNKLRTRLRA